MRRRHIAILIGAAALAAAGGAALNTWRMAPRPAADDAVERLLAATFDDPDGRAQPLAQWRGRLLVVNFWATWCPPCVEEMPDLQRVRDEFAGRGVEVIGLGIDGASRIREFRDRLGLRLPLLVAGAGGSQLGRDLGNATGALPFTVLISGQGAVVQRKLGPIKPEELRAWLAAQGIPQTR